MPRVRSALKPRARSACISGAAIRNTCCTRRTRAAMRTSTCMRSIRLGRPIATGVPPTRPLTNFKGVRTEIYAAPKAKPDILYIGLNDRDPQWHDLYELHISTGEKKLLRKNTEQIAGWDFDNDGNLRLAERTNNAGDTEVLRVDPDGFKQIYRCTVLESCGVATSTRATRRCTSPRTRAISICRNRDAGSGNGYARRRSRAIPRNAWTDRGHQLGGGLPHPLHRVRGRTFRGCISRTRVSSRSTSWLQVQAARQRDQLGIAFAGREHLDPDRGQRHGAGQRPTCGIARRRRWSCSTGSARSCHERSLSQRKPYEFKSSDGLEIRGYLTLPKGLPRRICRSSCGHTAARGRAILGLRHVLRSSSRIADTRYCSRISAARRGMERSSSTPEMASGAARCRTT